MAYDRTTYSPIVLEPFVCDICGKRRHTGRYSVRHDKCAKVRKQRYLDSLKAKELLKETPPI